MVVAQGIAKDFKSTWAEVAGIAQAIAREKGWGDNQNYNVGELLALVHAEISETLEALRRHNPTDEKVPTHTEAEVELADAVIRIMDLAERKGWDVAGAIIAKMQYNSTRPHRHGGKAF